MSRLSFTFPEPKVDGVGTFQPPPLSRADLNAIKARAEQHTDRQTRNDLFRLIAAVEMKCESQLP
jgi:hypothetical protein